MMRVTFHCGAQAEVEEQPPLPEDVRKSEVRNGSLRIVVGGKTGCPARHADGRMANCHSCWGFRRKSGRQEYRCYPADYEQEKEGKYKGKSFFSFAEFVIACFPAKIEVLKCRV